MMNLRLSIRLSFLLLFFFLIAHASYSQFQVMGKIIDEENQGVPFANVLLLNPVDSSLVKGGLTTDDGNYVILDVSRGTYLIYTSYIGYNHSYSDVFSVDSKSPVLIDDIVLTEGVTLDQVQIVARKPLYEQKIDRLVVNVANSITSAGGTALEVLERSPGVIINQQNNAISLIGKEGVVIMINDRISYQPAESIVQMLAGMSADNIESIELITTPPANLDAEGNAGYINIVLKQRTDLGLSGNASVSAGYGEGEVANSGINLNYRRGMFNLFSTYNFLLQSQKQIFTNYRKVFSGSSILENDLVTNRDPRQVNHNLRLGIDLQLTSNTVMGFLLSGYNNRWSMNAENNTDLLENGRLINLINLDNEEVNHWKHYGVNANLEHKFSSDGKLNFNIDFLSYDDNNPNDYSIRNLDPGNILLSEEETRSSKLTPIDITVAQVDYTNTLGEGIRFMSGLKYGHSEFINTVSAETLNNGNWEFLDQFTNESDLMENIAAAFASVDFSIAEKNSFKVGLRYEHTDSKLNTVKEGSVVDRQFGVLFPSAFYTRKINEEQNVNVSYSKRITRPTFNDMAPFAIFLDPNTFFFGNAGLQPAITNNIKVDYRYKSYLISFQYSSEDSTIAQFQERVDIMNNQQLFEPTNLSNTTTFSGSLSIPIYLGNSYSMQNNLIVVRSDIKSFYDETPVNLTNTNYNLNSTQTYKINDRHTFELNGFYNSAAIFGRFKVNAIYGLNLGFQKKFSNGSNLRFNVRDVFNSIKFSGGTDLRDEGFITDGSFDFSNRTFSLNYSFNFGNSKLKSARQRNTGSEEERRRVN